MHKKVLNAFISRNSSPRRFYLHTLWKLSFSIWFRCSRFIFPVAFRLSVITRLLESFYFPELRSGLEQRPMWHKGFSHVHPKNCCSFSAKGSSMSGNTHCPKLLRFRGCFNFSCQSPCSSNLGLMPYAEPLQLKFTIAHKFYMSLVFCPQFEASPLGFSKPAHSHSIKTEKIHEDNIKIYEKGVWNINVNYHY